MGVNTSPNMLLPVPTVGNEAGPQYATDVNNCLTLIDSHNHSPGYGVFINPNGMYINADLPFNDNNLTTARSVKFQIQPSPISGIADIGCVYVSGVDLYYNDELGNQIRITAGGGLAGTPGSITNMVPPAAVTYVPISQTFVFTSAPGVPANLDAGFIILRNPVLNSPGLTLQAPTLASDYSITLPELPNSNQAMFIDQNGIITTQPPPLGINPPGAIVMYGGTAAPNGYLMCDGTSYLRATYPTLFTAIGTAFGSADGTHFNVPDMRGYFPRAVDNGAGRDPDAAGRTAMNPGGNTGDAVGSVQAFDLQSHLHTVPFGLVEAGSTQVQQGANFNVVAHVTSATGGSETRPINAGVNFIIKT